MAEEEAVSRRFFPLPAGIESVERIAELLLVRIPENPVGMAESGGKGVIPRRK